MKGLLPDSIVGRLVLVFLVGLIGSQLIGLTIYVTDRQDTVEATRVHMVVERIVTMTQVLDAAPPDQRDTLAKALGGRRWLTTWLSEVPLVAQPARDWRARLVGRLMQDNYRDIDLARVRIGYGAPEDLFPNHPYLEGMVAWMQRIEAEAGTEALFVSLQLSDGHWVNVMAPFVRLEAFWTSGFFLSEMALTLTVLMIAFWAVNRSSSPLRLFTRAADRLGRDVDAPPVPEEGLAEVRAAAQAFNRMQARLKSHIQDRTQMLAAISHDLRTPITRLKLRAEFLDDDDMRIRMLADLDTMESMIAGTLAFARDDATHEPAGVFDLVTLVAEVVTGQRELGRDVTLTAPEVCPVLARPLALRRALGNLIDNAVTYGKRARVTLDGEAGEGGTLRIRVADDGPGIPEEAWDNVFKPFYRLDASRNLETGGSGLGLAVVRSVARAHGGEVRLANLEPRGIEIALVLPIGAARL